ncbi:MAG: hypothetical protein RL226_1863 [Bacteroidota bacterium]
MRPLLNNTLHVLLIICLTFVSYTAASQTDSTDYEYYDIVYLKKGGSIMGEIISHDGATGGLVIKDRIGRVFSLSREEYNYYLEDQQFKTKTKRQKDRLARLKERKTGGWEFSAGISAAFINYNESFQEDETYLSGGGTTDLPICLELGAGKYFGRQHFLGASIELPVSTYGTKYFTGGARYAYQYDAAKRNLATYIPIELRFFSVTNDVQYNLNDTLFIDENTWQYPAYESINVSMSGLSLSLGHGFGFILPNKHSFMLELALVKHFILSHSYATDRPTDPNSSFTAAGMRVGFRFNF